MSETNEAIASLRSSIDVLRAIVAGIQAQVCTKVDTTAFSALDSRVTACEGKISELGTPVAAQGQTVTGLTNTITHEASAREDADDALCTHIGALSCGLQDNRAAARAISALATRVSSAEEPTLEVDPGKAIEPLRMGTVTFYGESARAIRDAQEVLRAAGAGQLEVVKRESQGDSPFFVVDGQAFITAATIKDSAIDPARISVKVAVNEQGQYYVAGVGLGLSDVASELKLGPSLEKDVRRLFREELIGAGAEKAINERLGKIELDLLARKGREDAAKITTEQRLAALESVVGSLKLG